MMKFIRKLFYGNVSFPLAKANNAVKLQIKNLESVWNSKTYNDFGIERIFRLFLVLIQFAFLGLYVRDITGRRSVLCRKIGNEVYVIVKILIYLTILFCGISRHWLSYICLYLITETICYLLGLIFLNTEYSKPISYKRNLLLTMINYIEITFGFACIYYCSFLNSIQNITSALDSVCYSFTAATTVGYGSMFPVTNLAKTTYVFQSVISLFFVIFIFSVFVSSINEKGYINKSKNNSKND